MTGIKDRIQSWLLMHTLAITSSGYNLAGTGAECVFLSTNNGMNLTQEIIA